MNSQFGLGFLSGFLCKEYSLKILRNFLTFINTSSKISKINQINNVYFICKITNKAAFNDYFPEGTVQPYWEYYPENSTIKIKLDQDLVDYLNKTELDINVGSILSFSKYITLDYAFFQKIGELYMYVCYTLNEKEYINVYTPCDKILSSHFKETNNTRETPSVVCLKTNGFNKYITGLYKKFLNNPYNINAMHLILFDVISFSSNTILSILNKDKLCSFSINEVI